MPKRIEKSMNDDHWTTPAELQSLEAELSALCPRDDRLDRDRVMFHAGQAMAERERSWTAKIWPSSCAAMTAIAATLAYLLLASGVDDSKRDAASNMPIASKPAAPITHEKTSWANVNQLSSAPHQLKVLDLLLAQSADSRLLDSDFPNGEADDWNGAGTLSPTSFQVLLDESVKPDAHPLDSSFYSRNSEIDS